MPSGRPCDVVSPPIVHHLAWGARRRTKALAEGEGAAGGAKSDDGAPAKAIAQQGLSGQKVEVATAYPREVGRHLEVAVDIDPVVRRVLDAQDFPGGRGD